jgi:succinate dehydrogenase hydrophobic anchor subunit
MELITRPRPFETTAVWLAKIVTGVLVFAILIIHLVVNHLVAEGGLLTYNDVLRYYKNPIIPLMEGFFLVFVVTHALLGVRGIVLDLGPQRSIVRLLDVVFVGVGIVSISYGLWLLITLAMRAAAIA